MSGWGAGTWSSGYWGGVEDVLVAITGANASGSAGDAALTFSQAITGVSATGSVGIESPGRVETLTAASASGNAGTMVPTRFLELTGSSASGTVGVPGYYYWTTINDVQIPNWTVITTF